ncbi:hypothetical protein G647_08948 [Cladophialophora carrionii CBS 160.54]|uniref:Uncharacterized protein n=1 Tax=Cladophialophora carrionii CBS 160.54 TaxID=1279043 RepID=V9D0Z3_9EURO|nr:uncharacterized protein G647_08948 [Cladophialophora carrionii CBS 160.54]ETI19933.1 hypothetical protein G647_08948 [Cladophialophora carrionii CBS 160.54]
MTAPTIAHHAFPLHHTLAWPLDVYSVDTVERERYVTPTQTTPETEVHHFPVLTKPFDTGMGMTGEGVTPPAQEDVVSNFPPHLLTIPPAPAGDMPGHPILALGDGPHQNGQEPRVSAARTTIARTRSSGGSKLEQWYTSPTVTDPFHLIRLEPHNITWQVRREVNSKPDHHVDDGTSSADQSSVQEDTQSDHAGDDVETQPTSKMSF